MNNIMLDMAKDFSFTPGGRYKKDGPHSAEEFRENFLRPYLDDNSIDKVFIRLDGLAGIPATFLDEAFIVLMEEYGKEKFFNKFIFEYTKESSQYIETILEFSKEV